MNKVIYTILILISIDFFSSRFWIELPLRNWLMLALGSAMLVVSLYYIFKKQTQFRMELFFFLITLVFSALSSNLLYNQGFFDSYRGSMVYTYSIGLYFLAHHFKLKEDFIFKMLLYVALVFTAIEVVEQFTYPDYWFCGRIEKEENDTVEMRMGLWRMYIYGIYFCLLSFTLVLQKVIEGKDFISNILLLIVIFIGIVFFVARKDIYAAVSVVFLGVLFGKGKNSSFVKIIIGALVILSVFVLSETMASLNEQSADELDDFENFIRVLAAKYFLFDMNSSPFYYMFGAGIPFGNSPLVAKITYLANVFRFFQSDCGFIGYFSKVGAFGLLPWVIIIYKILKNYKYVDLSLLLFLVIMIELSFFDFWGQQFRNVAASMLYLYLVDRSITRNKLLNNIPNGKSLRKAVL